MGHSDSLAVLSGVVSHVERRSETSGYMYDGYGSVKTRATDTQFRVAGKPASFPGAPVLSNGDRVHMVGNYRSGVFYAESLTNLSVGLVYGGVRRKETIFAYVGGVAALAFAGLCTAVIAQDFWHTYFDNRLSRFQYGIVREYYITLVVLIIISLFTGIRLIQSQRRKNRQMRRYQRL